MPADKDSDLFFSQPRPPHAISLKFALCIQVHKFEAIDTYLTRSPWRLARRPIAGANAKAPESPIALLLPSSEKQSVVDKGAKAEPS